MNRKVHPVFDIATFAKRGVIREHSRVVAAIDPGLRRCGVAVLIDGWLHAIGVVENPSSGRGGVAWLGMAEATADFIRAAVCGSLKANGYDLADPFKFDFTLAAERMVVRSTRRDVDADDLLELAGIVGAVAGTLRTRVALYRPEEWKGQVPKRIHHPRIIRDFSLDNERAIMANDLFSGKESGIDEYVAKCKVLSNNAHPEHKAHNALDALGIAQKASVDLGNDAFIDGNPASDYKMKNPPFTPGGFYWDKLG